VGCGLVGKRAGGSRPEGDYVERVSAFGPKLREEGFFFSFSFPFISKPFSNSLSKAFLNHFEFWSGTLITINYMCHMNTRTMLLHPYDKF
jgi:hypothetical protein